MTTVTFDTHQFIKKLEAAGLAEAQAEACKSCSLSLRLACAASMLGLLEKAISTARDKFCDLNISHQLADTSESG